MKSKFKDKCDICNTWQFDCHGYKDQVLCPSCIQKMENNQSTKLKNYIQLTIFNEEEKNNYKKNNPPS